MQRQHIPWISAFAVALVLSACSSTASPNGSNDEQTSNADDAQTITVTHKQGETEVQTQPEKVVVFDYGSLDTLQALDVEVVGTPQDNLPDALSAYGADSVENVGTLFEPDYEAINAIDPDLVIVGGRSAEAYPELSQHWPTIDLSVDFNSFLEDVHTSTETLGEIFGKEQEAQSALQELDAEVEEVKGIGQDAGPGMIVSTSGGEVTVYGEDSRFGIIHTVLGVPQAVNDVEALPHGEVISFEMIRDTDPEWLFVNDRDAAIGESGESARAILDNELVHATQAWEHDQVVYLDAQRWYIIMSGVDNAKQMFAEIGEALNGTQ